MIIEAIKINDNDKLNDGIKMLNVSLYNYYIVNYFIDFMIVNTHTLQVLNKN